MPRYRAHYSSVFPALETICLHAAAIGSYLHLTIRVNCGVCMFVVLLKEEEIFVLLSLQKGSRLLSQASFRNN